MGRPRPILLALASLAVAAPMAAPAAPGPNLLPNPSFELSALEPDPVDSGTLPQPLLPEGWIFEGAAGLFDHYPADTGGRTANSGMRAIAISIPASGKRQQCVDQAEQCVDNPLIGVYEEMRLVYSATPHWRNAMPVPVEAGATYRLTVHTSHEVVTDGEGATTFVRWLDGNGLPIGVSQGPIRLAGPENPENFWAEISGTMVAPAGATQAIVLLGHTDDLWIGQVRFDDVHFGLDG